MHLRIWFIERVEREVEKDGIFGKYRTLAIVDSEEISGIVVAGDYNMLMARTDEGKFYSVYAKTIKKSEWVNHPETGE